MFLLVAAVLIAASSFAPKVNLNSGVTITNDEMWALGISPALIALGLILAVAAVVAWHGSVRAFRVCLWWAALYSMVIGGLVILHYPAEWLLTIVLGVSWAALWYLSIRRWNVQNGV